MTPNRIRGRNELRPYERQSVVRCSALLAAWLCLVFATALGYYVSVKRQYLFRSSEKYRRAAGRVAARVLRVKPSCLHCLAPLIYSRIMSKYPLDRVLKFLIKSSQPIESECYEDERDYFSM